MNAYSEGKTIKHHRGNPTAGIKKKVFEMVEQATNIITMYPVNNRSRSNLLPILSAT